MRMTLGLLAAGVVVAGWLPSTAAAEAVGGAQAPSAPGGGSVLDGVFTEDQATRGRKTYQAACTSCHTVSEQTGRRFVGRWRDSNLGEVFDLISGTMPEGNPGSLTPEEYASIVAFYLKETGYREGSRELPATLPELLKLRIQPPR